MILCVFCFFLGVHPESFDQIKAHNAHRQQARAEAVSQATQAQPQFKTVVKFPLKSVKQLDFDMIIMEFIVDTNQPFSIVEENGFIKVIHYLDNRFTEKCVSTFAKNKLPLMYKSLRNAQVR